MLRWERKRAVERPTRLPPTMTTDVSCVVIMVVMKTG